MITNTGYVIIPEEERFNSNVQSFKRYYPNISENPSNLAMILARLFARDMNELDYNLSLAHNNAYIAHAVGANLDKAVRTAGIWRLSGTRSSGRIRIEKDSAVAQLIIPANTVIVSDGKKYITQNDNAIIQNTQYLEFEIKSDSVGSIYNIAKDSKFKPYESMFGIKDIVAVTDISGASDRETDSDLRIRYYERMEATTSSSLRGIIDYMKQVEGVIKVDGRHNTTNTTVDNLPPHSYEIFVKGGTYKDIGLALSQIAPAGIQSTGDISVDVPISQTNTEQIRFTRFVTSNVYYDVEVVISPTASQSDVLQKIKDKLIEYTVDNNKIVNYEVSNFLSQQIDGIRGIKKILFGLSPNPTDNATITATVGKLFFTSEDDINVKAV